MRPRAIEFAVVSNTWCPVLREPTGEVWIVVDDMRRAQLHEVEVSAWRTWIDAQLAEAA